MNRVSKVRKMTDNKFKSDDFRRLPIRIILHEILQKYVMIDLHEACCEMTAHEIYPIYKCKEIFAIFGKFRVDCTESIFQIFTNFKIDSKYYHSTLFSQPQPNIVSTLYLLNYPIIPHDVLDWFHEKITSVIGGWSFDNKILSKISKAKNMNSLEVSQFMDIDDFYKVFQYLMEIVPSFKKLTYLGSRQSLMPQENMPRPYMLSGEDDAPILESDSLLTYETCFFQEKLRFGKLKSLKRLYIHDGVFSRNEIENHRKYTNYCRNLARDLLRLTTIRKIKLRNMQPLRDKEERKRFYQFDKSFDDDGFVCVEYKYQVKLHCHNISDEVYIKLLAYLMSIPLDGITTNQSRKRTLRIELGHINVDGFWEIFKDSGIRMEIVPSKELNTYATVQVWRQEDIATELCKKSLYSASQINRSMDDEMFSNTEMDEII